MSARYVLVLAGLLACVPSSAQALELKNIRPAYGFLGATRHDMKFLPGDVLFVTYEIDGLKVDAKNKVNFVTLVEVFDAANKTIFSKETPNVVVAELGGGRIPGDLHVTMGVDRTPGQYKARLTVYDVQSKDKKFFVVPFELLGRGFGLVAVHAPAVAFPAQPYMLQYAIVELGLDANKKPQAKLETKILDEAGKPVSPPSVTNFPADLTDNIDLKKANFIPIDYPIFPTRPGRFTVEITLTDAIAQKTATLRYPLNVLDVGAIAGK